jgi:hypothetical protein
VKVSVVIPTYNHRDFVLAAIESVFAQTMSDYEVSSSRRLARRHVCAASAARRAGRIRLIEQANAGKAPRATAALPRRAGSTWRCSTTTTSGRRQARVQVAALEATPGGRWCMDRSECCARETLEPQRSP